MLLVEREPARARSEDDMTFLREAAEDAYVYLELVEAWKPFTDRVARTAVTLAHEQVQRYWT